MWVGHGRTATWITSIDPRTGTTRRFDVVVRAPRMPKCIGGELWVTNEDSALRVSPRTGEVLGHIPLGGTPAEAGVAVSAISGFRMIWVTNKERSLVHRIEPSSGHVVDTFPAGPGALAQARFGRLGLDHELRRLGRAPLRPLNTVRGGRSECTRGRRRRAEERPIRLVVEEDTLERSRLTVLFRLLLALPLFVWAAVWGIAVFIVAFVLWLAVVISKKVPEGLHDFVAGYVRYTTHVGAYVLLAADPYPWFKGSDGYPVDLDVDPPVEQGRLGGFFRLLLAAPALILSFALGGGFALNSPGSGWSSGSSNEEYAYYGAATIGGTAAAAAFLAWFAILARGRAPRGLRDLIVYTLGYSAQAIGYLFLLTPRYPSSDPALAEPYSDLPEHPVRIVADGDASQSRLTVFFRLLLAIPHILFWLLWAIVVFFAVIVAWIAALVTGRVPESLHRFLAAFVRYGTHLGAYVSLLGRRFPGFTGQVGTYEVDLELPGNELQSRWKTLFRLFLAIPAMIVASALGGVLSVIAFFGWFYALATGRMPDGMRNLGISCLRYSAQTYAYFLLVTDRYPFAAPVLRQRASEEVYRGPLPAFGDGR